MDFSILNLKDLSSLSGCARLSVGVEMNPAVKNLLEQLLRDIEACRKGDLPTMAALHMMSARIRAALKELPCAPSASAKPKV